MCKRSDNVKNITFLDVTGFYASGSSAVVDLLKEFKNTYECKAEVRFIVDPYGLTELENALVHNWELINSSAAITDYLDMCKKWSRRGGGHKNPFAHAGLSYVNTINKDFMKITEEYVNRLTKFQYQCDYYHTKFQKSYLKYVMDRCRYAIELYSGGRLKTANRHLRPCYFAHPTQEEFNLATQEYLEKLFANNLDGCQDGYIILDQALSANNTQILHRYFKNAKMIIVDRDPRDMYVDEIVNWGVRHDDDNTKDAGKRYVMRYKALHDGIVYDDDILKVQFEDLVLNYNSTVEKIIKFFGWTKEDHINPKKFLKPEISCKNVGIWKKYYNDYKDALDVISEKLKNYCVERLPEYENIAH